VRSAVALMAVVAPLVGCGNEQSERGAASPRVAFERFVTAVVQGDEAAGDQVSRELDEDERESYVRAAREDIAAWGRDYRIIFDHVVEDGVAVVAAEAENHPGPGAYVSVLVNDGGTWFIEPNRLDLIYGVSATGGTAVAKPNVDFQVNIAGRDWHPAGRLWLDGNEVRLSHEHGPARHRFAAGIRRLHKRLYSAVAFARVGDRRAAIAWTFRAA
jgi:hypothetical protein